MVSWYEWCETECTPLHTYVQSALVHTYGELFLDASMITYAWWVDYGVKQSALHSIRTYIVHSTPYVRTECTCTHKRSVASDVQQSDSHLHPSERHCLYRLLMWMRRFELRHAASTGFSCECTGLRRHAASAGFSCECAGLSYDMFRWRYSDMFKWRYNVLAVARSGVKWYVQVEGTVICRYV